MKLALTFLAASTIGAVALTGIALAQPGGGGGPPGALFGLLQHDANGDGRLTRAEFDAAQKARFEKVDANKDGSATPDEVRAYRESQRQDARSAAVAGRFEALDEDKNGQVSRAEFSRPSDAPMGKNHGGRPGDRKIRARHGGNERRPEMKADANGDGKLSAAEFANPGLQAFTKADSNKDGVVTISELQMSHRGRF